MIPAIEQQPTTFGRAPIGATVRYCGHEFTILEHVPGGRPESGLTVCRAETPIQGKHECTFASWLPCDPPPQRVIFP